MQPQVFDDLKMGKLTVGKNLILCWQKKIYSSWGKNQILPRKKNATCFSLNPFSPPKTKSTTSSSEDGIFVFFLTFIASLWADIVTHSGARSDMQHWLVSSPPFVTLQWSGYAETRHFHTTVSGSPCGTVGLYETDPRSVTATVLKKMQMYA